MHNNWKNVVSPMHYLKDENETLITEILEIANTLCAAIEWTVFEMSLENYSKEFQCIEARKEKQKIAFKTNKNLQYSKKFMMKFKMVLRKSKVIWNIMYSAIWSELLLDNVSSPSYVMNFELQFHFFSPLAQVCDSVFELLLLLSRLYVIAIVICSAFPVFLRMGRLKFILTFTWGPILFTPSLIESFQLSKANPSQYNNNVHGYFISGDWFYDITIKLFGTEYPGVRLSYMDKFLANISVVWEICVCVSHIIICGAV